MKLLLALIGLIYAVSPYDLLPDFFIGMGWVDDLILLFLIWFYFFRKKKIGFEKYFNRGARYSYAGEPDETAQGTDESGQGRSSKDPYRILGIEKGLSKEEIKKAYRKLANQYHPDKVSHLGAEFKDLAEKRFKEIHEAYEMLMRGQV
jgi:hypothetical protein